MRRRLEAVGLRLRTEFRDLVELFLAPGLAAVLPWPVCYRLFCRLSRLSGLYAQPTASALAAAQRYGEVGDPAAWSARHRLIQLVDHADLYLSRFRSDRWLERHVERSGGDWPQGPNGFLAIGFHWGVGLWTFRHLRSRGVRSTFLSMRFDRRYFAGQVVRYWYARLRMAEVERIGGAPVIYVGGSVERMRAVLDAGVAVVALIDVPPGRSDRGLPVRWLGRAARFPNGLTRLASAHAIPVATFAVGLERTSGRRLLRIGGPYGVANERALMDAIGAAFDAALREDGSAWHFWALIDRFLEPAGGDVEA